MVYRQYVPITGISLLRSKRTILQKFPRNPTMAENDAIEPGTLLGRLEPETK
jgi:hypothetical protein